MPEFTQWDSFYVIVGSAAGGLIGLQFVVVTLVAERPSLRIAEAGAAFATPNIVHFGTALFVAALLRVPWQTVTPAAVLLGLVGLGGAIYEVIVARRMRTQPVYKPEFDDWLFYAVLPLIGYTILVLSAFIAPSHLEITLFGIGAAALLFLFLGIRNAWDSISYHVFHVRARDNDRPRPEKSEEKTP
jgi:hypothetical protein